MNRQITRKKKKKKKKKKKMTAFVNVKKISRFSPLYGHPNKVVPLSINIRTAQSKAVVFLGRQQLYVVQARSTAQVLSLCD